MDNLIDNYIIGDDILNPPNKRKIFELEAEKNNILGLKKAYLLLTDTTLQKKISQVDQVTDEYSEEEEIAEEEEEEEEETEE